VKKIHHLAFVSLLITLLSGCGLHEELPSVEVESTETANNVVVQELQGDVGMAIRIVAGADEQSSSVSVYGRLQHVITDSERAAFGIQDAPLKDAIGRYFGRNPTDAYVRSFTPWGDLYTTYRWPEVKTVLTPIGAQILEISSEPVVVARNIFRNNYNYEATFNTSITDTVTDSSESHWSSTQGFEFSQMFQYEVGFLGTGGGGETTLAYSRQFGKGGAEIRSYSIGTTNGVTVSVPPNWGVQSLLTASRGKMKVRIKYAAHLEGCTAVNYYPRYQDHHFWCLDIDNVMWASGISNYVEFTEDIEIGFFSNADVELQRYVDLAWSNAGRVAGKSYCTPMSEPSDPHTWSDNFLCSSINHGLVWSNDGPIDGMRCTLINEPSDPDTWSDNYLCVPSASQLTLSWSFLGPIYGKECIQIVEPADPHTWSDNYLCY
jgi:hypothetical protein